MGWSRGHFQKRQGMSGPGFNTGKLMRAIWKGMADYYSLKVDGEINPDAAWFYVEPKEAAKEIQGKVAFWHGVEISSNGT